MKKNTGSDFYANISNRLLLIFVFGLFTFLGVFSQSATISAPSALIEPNLNTQTIEILLGGGETFFDVTLDAGNFNLTSEPTGLSVLSVTYTDPTNAVINLAFDGTDFDSDFGSLGVTINNVELTLTSAGNLASSNSLSVEAYQETSMITASPSLNEADLDGQSVTIVLTEETFDDGTLAAGNFNLINEPTGLSIQSVDYTNSAQAEVNLDFDGTDFDSDISIFSLSINAAELAQTSSGVLNASNNLTINAYDESVGIAPGPSSLDELALDASYLDITLSDEEFNIISGTIPNSNFVLNSGPTGLVIESVTAFDAIHARMQLGYPPGNDFDSPVTNFNITVLGVALRYTQPGENLTSNNLTITAYTENPQANLSVDSTVLEERWLDERTLTIDFVEERFEDYTTLVPEDFDLIDFPPGLDIGSITPTSAVSVDLHLQFNYTDFDASFPNLRVSINHNVLVQSGVDLVSAIEPAIANIESATLSPDQPLREDILDGRVLTVTLEREIFQTPGSVDANDFNLDNEPTGLTINSASASSATEAQITLQFNGTDFDSDITNFAVFIAPGELRYTSTENLRTDPIIIQAIGENPVASLTSDEVLTESTLDVRELTITLVQEEFNPLVIIDASHFRLVNEPPGLFIESAYRITPDSARILLQFVYDDFDGDITDFHVEILSSALIQTTSGWLATDHLTIYADTENPVANLSADSALTEERLGFRTLYIDLLDESFTSYTGLQTDNFALVNYPAGLEIQSVTGTADTSASLVLQFNGTDFDNNITDFHVLIDSLVLVQSTQDLATRFLPIQASLEPVITGISIDNDTMNIDQTVTVSITVESDQGNTFSLNTGSIGGYALTQPLRVNETSYISTFTVTEGGNDFFAYENIDVTNVQLYNGLIPGIPYSTNIIQDSDLLDANRPQFNYIFDATLTGPQSIGSEVHLLASLDEAGYTFTDTSHINFVQFSSPAIQVQPGSGESYNLIYTVQEGDNDVSLGNLELEVVAVDIAGNMSDPHITLQGVNDLSIDASRPLITRAYIYSTDSIIIVGETLEIRVLAGQSGYRNHEDTRINDVPVGTSNMIFNDLGIGTYQYLYTVQEGDSAVSKGNLAINIVLQDRAPYINMSNAFINLDSNNVSIYPNRPTAIVEGSTEICLGDSALVTISLAGIPPLEFDFTNGTDTITHSNYAEGIYPFWKHPTGTTDYTVTRVVDRVGNSNVGFGNALITVHPLPNVQIVNLLDRYAFSNPPVELVGTPADGEFTGPGIPPTPPWTFTPSLAGLEDSPHEIIYAYTDLNTCFNADTVIVEVIDAPGQINFQRSVACFNDSTFYITGYNDGSSNGSFSLQPTPPPGAFLDLGNDTAVLRPVVYDLNANEEVRISYTFTDATGQVLTILDTLTIEWLRDAEIYTITDIYKCQNDDPIDLSGNWLTAGNFSGPGVTGSSTGGYQFDPSQADLDGNLIQYVHTSENSCSVQDSDSLFVYFAPMPNFTIDKSCVPVTGGQIQFENLSDIGSSQNVVWDWNFDDIESGAQNFSDLRDPVHHYDTGTWMVTLTVRLPYQYQICEVSIPKSIEINPNPEADFTLSSNCHTDYPILIKGQEGFYLPDTISSRTWKIYSSDTEIFDTVAQQFSYSFPSAGTYRVLYRVSTDVGCIDSTEETISLSPTINLLSEDSYFEDFEDGDHGWTSVPADPLQNSWTYGTVDPGEFPDSAESGTQAWYTGLVPYRAESSWVNSPCFNFADYDRPMVSIDIKRSLILDKDGATLQYSIDNGNNWRDVGDRNDGGLNWYNSRSIVHPFGGQYKGWTGELIFTEDDQWYEAAHGLDELYGQESVQFRIAFGSLGGDITESNKGFAFDNFKIRQRNRLSVLEYFTNANTPSCSVTDTTVREIMEQVPADVIDIQYHAIGTQADKMNLENPFLPNNRMAVYGITGPPMAVLNGGYEEGLGYLLIYDFSTSSESPSVEDIKLRSLTEPDFKLTTVVNFTPKKLEISTDVEALKDLQYREIYLYAIVMQRSIEDPEYVGTNGTTKFCNVARKILPDARGSPLKEEAWIKGESDNFPFFYEETYFPLIDDSSITVVVFLQDGNTREILQAVTIPEYTYPLVIDTATSTSDKLELQTQVLLYPNPARELVNVYFEEIPREAMRFTLYDLSGKIVITDVIEPWQQRYTISLGDLEQGLYIVEIRTKNNKRVVHRGKLFHY